MKKNDIAQLIKSAKQGKQKEITELYNKTRDYAYRVARQYVPEVDIADAVQDAYISVFRTLATFDDTKDFTPWLHTIVKNKCIDLLKRNNKQAFVSDDVIDSLEDTDPLPITLLENSQKRSDILTIINGLTVGQRTAVVLHYLEGMSIREIADELGVTDGTVKRQLHLAKKAIKEAVLMEESEHDNKLYGIGAVPLLTKLLTSEVEQGAYTMPQALSAEVFSGIMSGIATSGIIAGGSLGGLMAMTLGGKVAVAGITMLAVLSTAGAGYLYIEKENAAEQTMAVMAQVEQLNEKIMQQGEIIKTLELTKATAGVNAADQSSLPGTAENSPYIIAPDGTQYPNPNYTSELETNIPTPDELLANAGDPSGSGTSSGSGSSTVTPAPEIVKPTPPAPPAPPAPPKPAPTPPAPSKPTPAPSGGSESEGSFDDFFKESGANSGQAGMSAGGGTHIIPGTEDYLKPHG